MNTMQSIDNEFGNDSQTIKEERGTFLLVLCILSWIFSGINFINVFFTFISGESKFAEKIDVLIEGTGVSFIDNAMVEAVPQLELILENFAGYHISNTLLFMIGILAVILMFKLKRIGFYMYIFYSILALFIQNYFLGELPTNSGTLYLSGFISVIFIILFALNFKKINQ